MSINQNERNSSNYASDVVEKRAKRVSERALDFVKKKFFGSFKKTEEKKLHKSIVKKFTRRIARTIKAILVASGGGIIAVVVIPIMFVAALLCTGFGLFFSNKDLGKYDLGQAVSLLDSEFRNQINVVSEKIPHDEIEVVNGSINWKEVLALYAVIAQTNANVFEIVTVDDNKLDIIRDVFQNMYTISSSTHQQENKIFLYINVSHKTVKEMIEKCFLDENQIVLLDELLSERNDGMWKAILPKEFS